MLALAAGLGTVASQQVSRAANDAWSTSPINNTFSGANWTTGATVPAAATGTAATTDALFFGTSSITALNNDDNAFSFSGLTFNAGASAFVISGNAFTLTGNVTNSGTNLETINNAISTTATRTFTMTTGGGNFTLGGNISGTGGGITTAGTGTLTLAGNNTYTGTTTINGTSTVNINSSTAFGTSTVVFNGGASIDNTSGAAITLTNNNTLSSGGTLNFSTGSGTAANSLDLGTSSFGFGGSRTVVMNGTGSLTLGTYTNTGTGPYSLTVTAGTNATTASVLTLRGISLVASGDNATRTLTITGTGTTVVNSAIVNGNANFAGALKFTGAAGSSLTISGSNNTYTGGFSQGATGALASKVNLNSATALGVGGIFTWSGGAIDNTSGAAIVMTTSNDSVVTNDVYFSTASGTAANSLTISGTLSESAGRTITLGGTGSLTFTGALIATAINNSTNVFTTGTGLASTSSLNFGGFVLAPTGTTLATQTINGAANVNFTGAITDNGTATNLTFGGSGLYTLQGNNTFNGLLTLSNGAAVLTVSGANAAASGGVLLNTGKLNVNSVSALGTGTFTLSGGTLDNTSGSAKTMTTNNAVVINASFAFGTSAGTTANNITLGSGSVSVAAARTVTLNGAGALVFGGPLVNTADSNRTFTVNNGTGTAATTSLGLGGINLTGFTGGAARTDTIAGSGTVNITGAIADGVAAGSSFVYGGSGTLISSGNNTLTGLTSISSGTLSLSGNNSAASGGVAINGGTLNINSAAALGSGTFTISGGVFDNTSGSAKSLSTNNAVSILGNAAYGTSAGTAANSITFGSGTVSMLASQTVTLNGAGSVTFGGPLAFTRVSSPYTETLTVNNGTSTAATTVLSLGGVTLTSTANAVTQTINGSALVNITGAIADGTATGSGFAYTGTSTLTSSGNNTLTGVTGVSNGTLVLAGNNSAASGGVTLTSGVLDVNSATALGTGTFTINGGILDNTSGSAKTGSTNNALVLGNDVIFSTSAGTINNSLNLGVGTVAYNASRTFTLNGAGALTIGSLITTTNNNTRTTIVNNGAGTTSTTALNINGYTLNGYTGGAFARTQVFTGSGTVNLTGLVTDGLVAGSGINYTGTGTLGMLYASSNYTGNTFATNGTLGIGADSTPTSGSVTSGPIGTGILVLNGGTVAAINGAHTIANNVAPGVDVAGTIGGTNALTFNGNLNLNTSGVGAHYPSLAVTNPALTTFAGGININGQNLTLSGSGNILVNSAIVGTGGVGGNFLTYNGTGNLTLSSTNTYAGPTTINSGKLVLLGSLASGSAVSVASAATLAGTGTAFGTVNVAGGGHLAPGNGGIGTLTAGALTLADTTQIDLDLGAPGTNDLVIVNGALVLDGVINLTNAGGLAAGNYQIMTYTGAFTDSGLTGPANGFLGFNYVVDTATTGSVFLDVTATPEPTTMALIGLGATGLLARRKRRMGNMA